MAPKLKIPADVKALAAKHGASIDVSDGRRTIVAVWLPKGSRWNAADTHCLGGSGDQSDAAEMWADFVERMSEGTGSCGDAECDTCHPEE